MKTLVLLSAIVLLFATKATAQVYAIPYESKGNVIELVVVNTSQTQSNDILVAATSIPSWVVLQTKEIRLSRIPGADQQTARFSFDAMEAPVGQIGELVFTVTENGALLETKTLQLQTEAPASFELHHNYPNPFNPATNISYQLPEQTKVHLQVFNLLGQVVSELVNNTQDPGKYTVQWDASRFASGMYFYRLTGTGDSGRSFTAYKKMLLVK